MRRKRRRRVRAAVRRTWMVVLVAIAVGAFAALPPSAWRNVERMVRGHLDTFEEAVGLAAERTADWLVGGAGAVRDALGEGSVGATLSGSARVIDGDTLEVRGTRIRLHGIDALESAQGSRPCTAPRDRGAIPRTGESIAIAASRSPSFKAGKTLRDAVRG